MYATTPIKMIVAVIEVESIIKDTPEVIWSKTKKYAGISKEFFVKYFTNHQNSYAIKFKSVLRLKTPKPLMSLGNNICAPQSYTYLKKTDEELFDKLDL